MPVTVAVDAMGGDHGLPVTRRGIARVPRGHAGRARDPGRPRGAARRRRSRKSRSPARDRVTMHARQRSRRDGRAAGRRAAQEEGFVDARRDQPGQGRRGAGLRLRRQHRRADGHRALRAEDAARHRPAGDRVAAADAATASTTVLDLGANVNCTPEQLVQFAVMGSALVDRRRRHRAADRRPAQHRRGGHQGQRRRQADGRAAEGVGAQFLRQRRGRRHLQGHDRRRRLRRLRRQRRAQGLRRPRHDARRLPEGRSSRAIR